MITIQQLSLLVSIHMAFVEQSLRKECDCVNECFFFFEVLSFWASNVPILLLSRGSRDGAVVEHSSPM